MSEPWKPYAPTDLRQRSTTGGTIMTETEPDPVLEHPSAAEVLGTYQRVPPRSPTEYPMTVRTVRHVELRTPAALTLGQLRAMVSHPDLTGLSSDHVVSLSAASGNAPGWALRVTSPTTEEPAKKESETPPPSPDYSAAIEDLGLSVRTYNLLKRMGVHTVNDIIRHSPNDFFDQRNFGQNSVAELVERLGELGLHLAPNALPTPDVDATRIEDLNLLVRTTNVLQHEGIKTVAQLRSWSWESLAALRLWNERNTEDLRNRLGHLRITLPDFEDHGSDVQRNGAPE